MTNNAPRPVDRTTPFSATNPNWWNDTHASAWERTKEALRRDWEQTKADFSSGGTDLNQNVTDTVKQAAGSQPVPPAMQKTRSDDPTDIAKRVEKDIRNQAKVQEKMTEARADVAVEQVRAEGKVEQVRHDAQEKVAEVQAKAQEKVAKVQEKAQEKAAEARDFTSAEPALRYGYAARSQYADRHWDDQLESRLRNEWTNLNSGSNWDDARAQVRHGWDYAGRNRIV